MGRVESDVSTGILYRFVRLPSYVTAVMTPDTTQKQLHVFDKSQDKGWMLAPNEYRDYA